MARWGRKTRETSQPKLLGLDLNKKRNITILLVTGTILTSFLLLSHFNKSLSSPLSSTTSTLASTKGLGKQSYELAFHSTSMDGSNQGVGGGSGKGGSDSGRFEDLIWELPEHLNHWNPLLPDKRPITDISMNFCLSSPKIWDVCSPASTAKEDLERGKWIRIDKDFNKGIGLTYNYLYVRRLQFNSNLPVVTSITLVRGKEVEIDPTIDDKTLGDWTEVGGDLRMGLWPRLPPMYLRYRTNTISQIKASNNLSNPLEPITELDILYGSEIVNPLFGFERILPLITGGDDDDKALGVGGIKGTSRAGSGIAVRRGIPILPPVPQLKFTSSGTFTILQVADLHFSVGPGECHDLALNSKQYEQCHSIGSDLYTLNWLERSIAFSKPDLIVLSGDQLNGQGTSWNSQSTILKFAKVLWEKKIPWTIVFGNHDEEIDLNNSEQMKLYKTFPNFIGEAGPESVDGVGNYMRSIRSGDSHNQTLFNLYFLDSHAYAKSINPWTKKAAYDWLKPNQINWFRSQSSLIKPFTRPYEFNKTLFPPEILYSITSHKGEKKPSTGSGGKGLIGGKRIVGAEGGAEGGNKKRDIPISENVIIPITEVTMIPDDGAQIDDFGSIDEETEGKGGGKGGIGVTGVKTSSTKTITRPPLAEGPTKGKPLSAKPNAMMFFHIPLPESYLTPDVSPSGVNIQSGERKEGSGAPKTNSGFFNQAILAQGEIIDIENQDFTKKEDEFWEGEFTAPTKGRSEVKIIANGHCHLSEDCRRVDGVWLCFGGGGSYSGYGKPDFDRRMRVYEISNFGETVTTFHTIDNLDEKELSRVGEIILVGEGAMGLQ